MPQLHERTMDVQRLGAEMTRRFWDSPELGELTAIEAARITAGWTDRLLVIALRQERHGDESAKKADEA